MSTADRNIALNGVSRVKRVMEIKRELTIELEERAMNEEYIEEHKINRTHIQKQQPWASKSIPLEYLPDPSTDWFPPVFHLGVALTIREFNIFATSMGIPPSEVKGDVGYIFDLGSYFSEACGLGPSGISLCTCDSPEHDLMFSLVSNYELQLGRDLRPPFKKMVEIIQEVFGPSKNVMWWLEYTLNHNPENYFWQKHRPEWIDGWGQEASLEARERVDGRVQEASCEAGGRTGGWGEAPLGKSLEESLEEF